MTECKTCDGTGWVNNDDAKRAKGIHACPDCTPIVDHEAITPCGACGKMCSECTCPGDDITDYDKALVDKLVGNLSEFPHSERILKTEHRKLIRTHIMPVVEAEREAMQDAKDIMTDETVALETELAELKKDVRGYMEKNDRGFYSEGEPGPPCKRCRVVILDGEKLCQNPECVAFRMRKACEK